MNCLLCPSLSMAGRTLTADDRTFGIAVLVSASESEAAQLMQNDPAVKQGVMKAELFPYQVALWSQKVQHVIRVPPNQSLNADAHRRGVRVRSVAGWLVR